MDASQQLVKEYADKYMEYIEMAGEKSPAFLLDVMARKIIELEKEINYYKCRLNYVRSTHGRLD
ncbi:hypothetical protein UFOVP844_8 [uncultured Caudovirales phage]|uniref:Uncharacterized protein n=1 Tax=uncultured Caudovirales phage TaxID=2100421 RepID=A0A6J5P2L6_9CAUD|nr:hypothetical protein UFOVP844_8 [uncultured Caudovirales phage]